MTAFADAMPEFLAYRQKLERDVAVDGDRLPRFSKASLDVVVSVLIACFP